jgi:hypothetical protein
MDENIKTGHSAILEGPLMAICEGDYSWRGEVPPTVVMYHVCLVAHHLLAIEVNETGSEKKGSRWH